jgi:hypothetical protein
MDGSKKAQRRNLHSCLHQLLREAGSVSDTCALTLYRTEKDDLTPFDAARLYPGRLMPNRFTKE